MTTNFNFPPTTSPFGSTSGGTFGLGNTGLSSGFGTQLNSTGLSFGFGNQTSTSSGLTLGSAGTLFSTASFPPATSQPTILSGFGSTLATKPSFSIGINPSSNITTPSSFGWAAPNPVTTVSTGFGFASMPSTGSMNTSVPPFAKLGTPLSQPTFGNYPATSASSVTGLGGVSITQPMSAETGIGCSGGKIDNKAVKEVLVPSEIVASVDILKKYIKDQKNIHEEITRISDKPLCIIQKETETLQHLLSVVSRGIQHNVTIVEKLKQETAQELINAEIAQRTRETSSGLQYENMATMEYFQNLVVIFESRMQLYRQKIEQMERHLMGLSQCAALTPQELTLAMKRIHETFVALAAQLQLIHEAVKTQKEHYINYRKVFYDDAKNLFGDDGLLNLSEIMQKSRNKFVVGPTPFSSIPNATAMAMASAINRLQQPTAGLPPTLGFSSGSVLYPNLNSGTSFSSNLWNSNLGFSLLNSSAIKPLVPSMKMTDLATDLSYCESQEAQH